jgi:hypothetical protein
MIIFKNAVLTFFLAIGMAVIIAPPAHAQNQLTNTMNFESSTLPYNWSVNPWSTCVGECNEGNQTRTANCRDNEGNIFPDSNCSHSAKPVETRVCDLADCQWKVGVCPSHIHPHGGGGSSSGGGSGMSESNPGVSDAGDGPGGTSGGSSGSGGGNGTGGGQM